MCGFLMPGRVVFCSIYFNEYKAGGIIFLLNKIKSRNSRFFYAIFRVFDSSGLESLDSFRLNMNKNMNN